MTQREAYLDALGIDRWERRNTAPAAHPEQAPRTATTREAAKTPAAAPVAQPREAHSSAALGLSLGPGQGSCLFVCGSEDDSSSALASDLARLLPEAPVWASTALSGDGTSLEAAISERLFTCVVFFGQAQAVLALGGEAPQQCGPARVAVVPELRRLAQEGESRKLCWAVFKGLGLGSP